MSAAGAKATVEQVMTDQCDAPAATGLPVTLSIVIKALNEEKNIERAVRSALVALDALGKPGEVILADSLSSDRTVDVAAKFPIRIVQLVAPMDRSCGAGAQLGYQIALGEFIYILDGDMEICPEFLPAALAELHADPALAGVAGLVEEMHLENFAFKNRSQRTGTTQADHRLDSLDMGGLYRRDAVAPTGYLTDRNLHAFEEFDLGARLRVAGWRLCRLATPSVRHFGHTDDSITLLLRRWRSGYALGHGELLRAAIGRPQFWFVLTRLRVFKLQFGMLAAWGLALLLASVWNLGWLGFVAILVTGYALAIIAMALRKRSFRGALFSLVSWHVGLAGLVRGFCRLRRTDPEKPMLFRVLQ